MNKSLFLCIPLSILTFSCSNIKVYQITNTTGSTGLNVAAGESGVRFYRPALHVWIMPEVPPAEIQTTTAETGRLDKSVTNNESSSKTTTKTSLLPERLKIQFVYLPDYSKEYIIRWNRGLIGNVSPKFTLTDGWNLTGFESEINTGVSFAFEGAGSAAAGAALISDANYLGPGLYRVDFNATGLFVLGARVLAL